MNKRSLALAGGVLLLASAIRPAAAADAARPAPDTASLDRLTELENAFTQVAEKAVNSVVVITSKRNAPRANARLREVAPMIPPEFRQFFNIPDDWEDETPAQPQLQRRQPRRTQPAEPIPTGKGSGVIIRADGYVLTNAHVIDGSDALEVRLHDGRVFDSAKDREAVAVVGVDKDTDLAVLRIGGGKVKELPVLAFADSAKVKVGQFAIAVGAPFNLDYSVSIGHVSQKGRYDVNLNAYENYIQTDASINPGNSGGPLLNLRGEIMGINEFIVTGGPASRGSVGVGFAIAGNLARQTADSMIANKGRVVRPWLGVAMQPLTPELKKHFGVEEGVLVGDVMAGDPAQKGGIRAGDVILKVGETAVKSPHDVQFGVLAYKPGDQIPVLVSRGGREVALQVLARERKGALAEEFEAAASGTVLESAGLSLEETKDGIKVTAVAPGSAAARSGLLAGDFLLEINRRAVKAVADAARALKETGGDTAVLYISRHDRRAYVALPVGDAGP